MNLMSFFEKEKNKVAIVYRVADSFNETTGKTTKTESLIASYDCIVWKGRAAESILSERIRTVTDMVIACDPGVNVLDNDRVTIDGQKFAVEYVDDIACQGEAVIIALKEMN